MIKITDLARVLEEQHELSKSEAEFFIPLLVDVLTTGLKADKQVKIKGLGTFKVTSVNARESVDVNTGERIIIEGREKISFTPEPVLRDKVNSPFEQFETVTVSDDADFSEIDERYQQLEEQENADSSAPVETVLPVEEKQVEVEPQDNLQEKSSPEPSPEPSSTVNEEMLVTNDKEPLSDNFIEDGVREQEVIEIPSIEEAPVVDDQPIQEERNVTETTDNISQSSMKENEEKESLELTELNELNEKNQLLRANLARTQRNQKLLIGAVCALLLVACLGVYYIGKQFAARDNRIEHLMTELHAVKQAAQVKENVAGVQGESASENAEVDSEGQENTSAADRGDQSTELSDKRVQDEKKEKDAAAKVASESAKRDQSHQNSQTMASKYDSDPRIRTGAYDITGVAQTVTVRKGQTLTSISKTYLGPGMECYMEAVNETKEVKEGDKVKIPALKLKKKSK
ncbi:MAG: HU family DNA-binding protein [Prevotella sp.]|nr:HU family DNA-binding protein [Prevotellaceae bacterium]MDY5843537.1 HU family DNA-binding protein [Prevotella sp.]